jgi:tetraacyldisaccharide 4'-kinase
MPSPKCIITTEKDAARLVTTEGLSDDVRQNLYKLPVHICFLLDQEEAFNKFITGYVQKNARHHLVIRAWEEQKMNSSHQESNKPQDSHKPQESNKPKTIRFK